MSVRAFPAILARFAIAAALGISTAWATVTPMPGATPQQGPAGTPFPNPVIVRVSDAHGNVAPGALVGFSFPSAIRPVPMPEGCETEFLGLILICRVAADAQGIATLGPMTAQRVGNYNVSAEAYGPGGSPYLGTAQLSFEATAAAPHSLVEVVEGGDQRTTLGDVFPSPIRVRVTRPDGSPVAGANVDFFKDSGPEATFGPYDPSTAHHLRVVTGPDGIASARALISLRGVGDGIVRVEVHDPHSLDTIVTRVKYTVTYDDGTTFASFQDLWWSGPAENGWGLTIAQRDDRLFNVVYAYDNQGRPTWFVVSSGAWVTGLGSVHQGNTYEPISSPYFAYDASRFEPGPQRGYLALSFDDPRNGELFLSGAPGSKRIGRFDFSRASPSPVQGVGGMWWGGPSQNGWGISIMEQQGALFVLWFTYGADRRPTWFVMSEGEWTDARTWSGPVFRTSGSPWASYDASLFRAENVGSFALRFDGPDAGTFSYEVEGHRGSMRLERFLF